MAAVMKAAVRLDQEKEEENNKLIARLHTENKVDRSYQICTGLAEPRNAFIKSWIRIRSQARQIWNTGFYFLKVAYLNIRMRNHGIQAILRFLETIFIFEKTLLHLSWILRSRFRSEGKPEHF